MIQIYVCMTQNRIHQLPDETHPARIPIAQKEIHKTFAAIHNNMEVT